MKVFMGGTCNKTTWREELIELCKDDTNIDLFNPVVEDWTEEAQQIEENEKQNSDVLLFVITAAMTGVFSIAEAVDCSNKCPDRTVFLVVEDGFDEGQLKSLKAVSDLILNNGGALADDLEDVAKYLKSYES